jgi:hypothetical protein
MSIIRRVLRAADKVCRSCGGYASNGYKCSQCMRLGK